MVLPGHFLSFPFRATWFLLSFPRSLEPNPTPSGAPLSWPWPMANFKDQNVCVIKRSMWTSGETTGQGGKLGLLPAVP